MLKDFTKERFDIFIQAGQSNSEGYGFGPAEHPYEPSEQVWYMNGDFTLTQAAETVTGNEIQSTYGLSFAREYLKAGLLKPDRKLLILRTSVGGTGFLDHRWGMTDDLYLRMMDMIHTALELNPENRLMGMLWHQGETDAQLNADYDTHFRNLSGLVRSVRETFHVPELPFIAGDFVQHWKSENAAISEPVIQAIRAVCRDCGPGAFVETDGLLSNFQQLGRPTLDWEDNIHFSRNSCDLLGQRYFDAYRKVSDR